MLKDGRLTLTIPEAAALLGIGKNQAYECARRGELPTIRMGHRILVPRASLARILESAETKVANDVR
jgi:excisionase family DNA binding protein